MELLIGVGIAIILIAPLVLPWINQSRIFKLREEVRVLRAHLNGVLVALEKQGIDVKPLTTVSSASAPPIIMPEPSFQEMPLAKPAAKTQPAVSPEVAFAEKPKPGPIKEKKPKIGFEQQFGARLPVWIGGIALAFAGFYMIKYSIEKDLLDENVRVALGGLFGILLLAAGHWIRRRPSFANGTRIAQALSGAGIADLYVSLFAAANLYHIISPVTAFIGMAFVTGLAVVLSLRHGAPIALLGLLGGFLTPALVGSSEPNTPLLFLYLYAVCSALMIVIRKERWWWLSIPTVLGAFGWVVLWLMTDYHSGDSLWVGLFLLGISATVVAQSRHEMEEGDAKALRFSLPAILNYLTLGGACALMGFAAYHSGFTLLEWGFFGLLAAGGVALSWFNYKVYWFTPWLSLAVSLVMIASWNAPSNGDLIIVVGGFAALFVLSGAWLLWRSERPVHWALISAASAILYYLLAHLKLSVHDRILAFLGEPARDVHFWGFLAMGLAVASFVMTKTIMTHFMKEEPVKQRVMAAYALATTAFVCLSLCIEIPREFLSVALALEILAIAVINLRFDIHALRWLALGVGVLFALILMPQLTLLLQITLYSLTEVEWQAQASIPIVSWPLFQLGLPAILFAASSILLRKKKDDWLVQLFEVVAVALFGIMGYYLARHAFHTPEDILFVTAGFTERGVITAVLFLFGLGCLVTGRRYVRLAISWSGLVLCGVALFRTAYFDLILYNPLLSDQSVGTVKLLNSLVITYAAPVGFIQILNRELKLLGRERLTIITNIFLLVLAFFFVTCEVSQFYHGEYLGSGEITNAEIYTYSAVWLLLGIALLFMGTLKHDRMIRIASLVVILLSVGKVFLYDASELTGLYRVFSFLGLGICLMGLSYFYTRFVFGNTRDTQ